MNPHFILEVANCHGGSLDYVSSLLDELADFRAPEFGMKFQPFQADELALPDYSYHPIYQRLYFEPSQWKGIIHAASRTKAVWLDLFDRYSVAILRQNLDEVVGLKLQASVLANRTLIADLAQIDLSSKRLILNVAARRMDEIERIAETLNTLLRPGEIILQIGFQAYPTVLADSGLAKLRVLRERLPYAISFADHVDAASDDALWLPTVAALLGATVIEKHVRHSTLPTEFDHYSSVPVDRVRRLLEIRSQYSAAVDQPFINRREEDYLRTSLLVPVLSRAKTAGDLLSQQRDFEYKRTSQAGLDVTQLEERALAGSVLATAKEARQTLRASDFRAATVATLVHGRLSSPHLPRKVLAKVGERRAIDYCLQSCLAFPGVHHTVLVTSADEEDAELGSVTQGSSVLFRRGRSTDIVQRYIDVADELRADVIIRATADGLFYPPEIAKLLLREHFRLGADYTSAAKAAVGTNLEIFSTNALRRIVGLFPTARPSEELTSYFENNPTHFHLNYVDLPSDLTRDYRLVLEHPEDLEVLQEIDRHYRESGRAHSGKEMFSFLDAHPEVTAKNQKHAEPYATQQRALKNAVRTMTTLDPSRTP